VSFKYLRKIPTPDTITGEMPLEPALKKAKELRDKEIISIFEGKSKKFLVIIGPCSADDEDAVCEYVSRLAKLQAEVADKIVLVPRVYTNKPRTTGQGYKGMLHQPDPMEEPNIAEGVRALRRLHIRIIRESGLTAADEMLYPGNYPYLEDLLSYVAIGARSVENQEHRLTVSGLDIPVGMKNPTSGDLNVMLNSVQAAQLPHIFIYNGYEVKTAGNRYAHCILRGAINHYGRNIPNYHYEDLVLLAEMYRARDLLNLSIIVDTNHANSNKVYQEQPRIAMEVLNSIKKSTVLKNMVKGLLIESYIAEGSQDVSGKTFGQSITDPCLGWEDSRKLILQLAAEL